MTLGVAVAGSALMRLPAGLRSIRHRVARSLIAAVACLFLPASAIAQQSPRAMIRLADGRPGPAANIGDLAWLEGHWEGAMPEGPVEHVILSPRHGQMPSFVRAIGRDGVLFYEISVFTEHRGSLAVRVKHFTPDMIGWEAQRASIDRPLVERDGNLFRFDGITFERQGPDAFTVYFLNRKGALEGDTLVIPFRRR